MKMTKDSEKMMRDLEKFLNSKKTGTESEMNGEIREFIQKQNKKAPKTKGKDAWDYVAMAYEADSEEEALQHARKALQLDKNCLDAEVLVADLTADNGDKLKATYEKLIKKEEARLTNAGFFQEENKGDFWLLEETRPYMRLRYSYVRLLLELGKHRKAITQCEEMLVLCEGDNLGVRFLLISLYAFFEDEVNAIRIHKQFEEESSAHMLLPLVVLYYKMDQYKNAEGYLKKLKKVNDGLEEVFNEFSDIEEELDEIIESGMYQYGSSQEIIAAMGDAPFLFTTSTGFYLWMADRV